MPRLSVQVQGVVQGVGFRPFVYRIALARGLVGWVRNRPDGVEIEVQGAQGILDDFLRVLKDEKPSPARIVYSPLDALTVAEQNPDKEVVFFAVGFETTAPSNAMAVSQARKRGLKNFSILVSTCWCRPPWKRSCPRRAPR